jgi:hypothetical protein
MASVCADAIIGSSAVRAADRVSAKGALGSDVDALQEGACAVGRREVGDADRFRGRRGGVGICRTGRCPADQRAKREGDSEQGGIV